MSKGDTINFYDKYEGGNKKETQHSRPRFVITYTVWTGAVEHIHPRFDILRKSSSLGNQGARCLRVGLIQTLYNLISCPSFSSFLLRFHMRRILIACAAIALTTPRISIHVTLFNWKMKKKWERRFRREANWLCTRDDMHHIFLRMRAAKCEPKPKMGRYGRMNMSMCLLLLPACHRKILG